MIALCSKQKSFNESCLRGLMEWAETRSTYTSVGALPSPTVEAVGTLPRLPCRDSLWSFHFSPARFRSFDAGSICSALFDSYPNPGARIEFFFELPTDRLGTYRKAGKQPWTLQVVHRLGLAWVLIRFRAGRPSPTVTGLDVKTEPRIH